MERPSDTMRQIWMRRDPVGPMIAGARLRASWDAAVARGTTLEYFGDDEMFRVSDAPWWCLDPRTDTLYQVTT